MNSNRRRFLRQVGLGSSAALLTAIGGRLAVQAAAPAQMDRHLIVNVHGNTWWPKLMRPDNHVSDTEWAFNEALEPLQPYRERSIYVEGLYNPYGSLHGNYGATLSVTRGARNRSPEPSSITIDRQIAKALGDGVPFSSINFGHPYGRNGEPFLPSNVSADGPGELYPPLTRPADVIDQLFGDAQVDPQAEIRSQMRTSLLDAMAQDIASTQGRLAAAERASMDQYLSSVRQLEEQFAQLQEQVCEAPAYDGPPGDFGVRAVSPELSHFYFHAASTVLTCGLTRVVTIANEGVGFEPLQPTYAFDPVDMPMSLHNSVNHALNGLNNNDGDASDRAWAAEADNAARCTRLYRWRAQQVADLFDRLGEVPLAGQTLGDRTMMMWTNTGGGRHHQGHNEIPMLFIGNPDGVFNAGRYERYSGDDHCVCDTFTAVAHAMGAPVDSFGTPDLNKGPMPGWLA